MKSHLVIACSAMLFSLIVSSSIFAQSETPQSTLSPSPSSIQPALSLLFHDTFDSGELVTWEGGDVWQCGSDRQDPFLESRSTSPLQFLFSSLRNIAAEIRFQMEGGTLELAIRQTQDAEYSVRWSDNGQLILARGNQVLQTVEGVLLDASEWHRLRLGAIGNTIQVTVDDQDWITFADPQPLPAGSIAIRSVAGTPLRIDDFKLWVPISQLPPTAVTAMDLTATPTSGRSPCPTSTALSTPSPMPTALPTTTVQPTVTRMGITQTFEGPSAILSPTVTPLAAPSATTTPTLTQVAVTHTPTVLNDDPVPSTLTIAAADQSTTLEPCTIQTDQPDTVAVFDVPEPTERQITYLAHEQRFLVRGQAVNDAGQLWYRLDELLAAPGQLVNEAWVAAQAVQSSGDCQEVPEEDRFLRLRQFERMRFELDAALRLENTTDCVVSGVVHRPGVVPILPFFVYPHAARVFAMPAGPYELHYQGVCVDEMREIQLDAGSELVILIEATF